MVLAEGHTLITPPERPSIGSIKRVTLREVWPHEAFDFTRWLQDNLEELNQVLDVPLTAAEREQPAGSFNIDLVAEDESGNTVIIENQLERSNHDHLGKLLTYLVGVEARAAIWIVSDPRPEHVKVINWLNESSSGDFYLIKVEAIRIGESAPAPLFTRIVGPSEEARQIGDTRKELAERDHSRRSFWIDLLERASTRTKLHAAISPSTDNWISTGAGKGGLGLNYVVLQHGARVELYIDTRDQEENDRIFNALYAQKESIENRFGGELGWDHVEGRQSSRVRYDIESGGYLDEERWPEIHDEMIDAMIRLERALRPVLRTL